MILKELRINNFRSYYKESIFEFKDGLTLIIGGNGDGKTTFFDALDWLFATDKDNKSPQLVSEKRKAEMLPGESDTVSVSLVFEHDGEKFLEKQFRFEKDADGDILTRDFSFQGYDGIGAEREMVRGSQLLDRCFDAYIRKYCLFKGESELNVFDNDTALKTLVDKFSDIREFDEYVDIVNEFTDKSEEAYKKELKNDKKVSAKAKDLERRDFDIKTKISDIIRDLKIQESALNSYQIELDKLEEHQETCEKYREIKKRIQNLEEKASKTRSLISENYNVKLLDEKWILSAFPGVFEEYRKKVSAFSKEKRKLNEEHIAKQAKEKGKREAAFEMSALVNGSTHLPWDLPDDQTMQEMIDEQICKVCNRPAEIGSEAYNFMKAKLDNYLRSIDSNKASNKEEDDEDKQLFVNSYIEELHNLNIYLGGENAKRIANLNSDIKDHIEFNIYRKKELSKIEEEIEAANDAKSRLLIQNNDISEDLLDKNFSDIKGFFDQKNRTESKIETLRIRLNALLEDKKLIDKEYETLSPNNGMVRIYSKVHTTFEKILKAFDGAKKANLRRFLSDLEDKANDYLKLLNIDDFHGIIRIIETANESARIQLSSSNGTVINNPNGALKTTMYMSVLFAISDLTTRKREIDYPLIFDAPTSSFESFKEDEFYNVIDKIKKQCIIVTKDLLDKDEQSGTRKLNEQKIKRLTCSVYRIEKQRPFNETDLSTICTITTPIK